MAYTEIDDPSAYFQTALYTGDNANTKAVTFDGNSNMQPDLWWGKTRSTARNHNLIDSIRGVTKTLQSDVTSAELSSDSSGFLASFNSNGFTTQKGSYDNGNVNVSGRTYANWCWKEQPGVFDIVSFTGNGNARTISHNLGVVPKFIIIKDRDQVRNWGTYHVAIGPGKDAGYLNNNVVPEANNNFWNNTTPTASVFSVGTDGTYNGNGNDYIVYLFGDSSMSKCSSYTGNGSGNGTFIYTGFKPAWTIIKRTDSADNWVIDDVKRSPTNTMKNTLYANLNNAEYTSNAYGIDFLSNGFKIRNTDGNYNSSGGNYIYTAFAENPFVSSTDNGSIPACAR